MKKFFVFSALVAVATVAVRAEVVKIELPPETATYKEIAGVDLANAQCLSCHSVEYASLQPPMARPFWKDSVDKMISKYGAPIPADQVEALADYLVRAYGNEQTNAAPKVAVTEVKADGVNAKGLFDKYCVACHRVGERLLAPSLKEVAKKYAGNPEGIAKVSHQINNGGAGQWGGFPIPMPPFKQFSQTEVKALAEWVLSQK
jgi:cytochrome c551/c552